MTVTRSTGLIIAGIALILVGGIGAWKAKDVADSDDFVDQLVASFDNRMIGASPDYTAMWILILVAAIGAVALIVGIALRPKDE